MVPHVLIVDDDTATRGVVSRVYSDLGWPNDQVSSGQQALEMIERNAYQICVIDVYKPGYLLEEEFNLIKLHPVYGFQVVQDIEFSWPIAQMITQHHERLDGSGYPAGLTGNQIELKAKIIAVSDVVEAMASYRPYRPSLEMERASKKSRKKRLSFR